MGMVGHHALPELPASSQLKRLQTSGTPQALRVSERAPRGELHRSGGGHYDVYEGGKSFDDVVRTELEFLHKHAAAPAS
jgi:hypothetical protein